MMCIILYSSQICLHIRGQIILPEYLGDIEPVRIAASVLLIVIITEEIMEIILMDLL